MLTKSRFRSAVGLSFVLSLSGAAVSCFGESTLPAPLQDHLAQQRNADFTVQDWLLLAFVPLVLAASLAVLFGMLRFQSWARPLSLAMWPLTFFLAPLAGPTVEPALASALTQFASALSGAILAASYLPPAAAWFEAPDDPPGAKDGT